MKCPYCRSTNLVRDTRNMDYDYDGESTVIKAVTGDYCSACGDVVLEDAESARVIDAMHTFHRKVNAPILKLLESHKYDSSAYSLCGACGANGLVHAVLPLSYTYKGVTAELPDVEGDYCTSCGEVILDKSNGDRYGLFVRDFRRRIDMP
ncbi:type II toxin-antitoxin system MqsA family antitoxin [Herbaspirillum sp. NPDC087042]|uniref:type II toxin-antitoxin system MqsA family antitoxin n=1 Tax=Herbaspirillum sp. NPDC087042 TaxID=3364004 RepID=UPI00382B1742